MTDSPTASRAVAARQARVGALVEQYPRRLTGSACLGCPRAQLLSIRSRTVSQRRLLQAGEHRIGAKD